MREFNEKLIQFIDASPTPFHAVEQMANELEAVGYVKLDECEKWELSEGTGYYVTRNDSSIVAFTYPPSLKGYTIVGAHTDSPHLRLKPNPVTKSAGTIRFGVEPYGGVLLNPWFDRDLSLAGRIVYVDEAGVRCEKLIDIKRPIGVVSSLAIHLDREANSNRSINAQTDIVPLMACGDSFDFESWILGEAGVHHGKLLAHELSFYDVQKGSFIGINNEFVTSARLDNLLSCYVGLQALLQTKNPMMLACMDHEEVGSDSHVGAGGTFVEEVLRRIVGEDFSMLMRQSLMVSCDNAHAQHPNFPSKHEGEHAPLLNCGVAVKINSNQRYATSARTMGRFVQCAQGIEVATQTFVTRSDMGCGSTIGPISATRLGIETIDVGVPTLAMHSIRELAGVSDAYGLYQILLHIGKF